MTKASAKIVTEALSLSIEERIDVVTELLASVDGPADPNWEQAWQVELDRRSAESDAGGSRASDWSAVRARVLSKLAQR